MQPSSRYEPGDTFDEPERREGSDRERRGRIRVAGDPRRNRRAPGDGDRAENGGDESEPPELGADVEREQRERNVAGRQPDLGQRAREAEPVQQAETERDDPGPALRQAALAAPNPHDLAREEQDRQRDRRLDRRAWHMNDTEGRER